MEQSRQPGCGRLSRGAFHLWGGVGPLCGGTGAEAPDWELEGQTDKLSWLFKGLGLVREHKAPQ